MRPIKIILLLCILCLTLPILAQTNTTSPEPEATETVELAPIERATVAVESAFVRELPDRESEFVASVFETDVLEIIGRNIDGLWFEVRRPSRMFTLGWVSAELLDYDFSPTILPMTDTETGLVGTMPIPEEHTPVAITAEANLRVEPFLTADVIALVPLGATLPATGRDGTGGWLFVNYRGNEGWLNSSVFRRPPNILDLPDLTFVEDNVAQLDAFIIPPEIQLGQLQAFRDFVVASRDVAADLVPFWEEVIAGEVMPCTPPDFVQEYLITRRDIQELPELNRYVPRYNEGVVLLNESIDALYGCGVLQLDVVREARNDATNANIIMNATLGQLDSLETLIRETNNLETEATETP